MPDGYGSQADYMSLVVEEAKEREKAVQEALHEAFGDFIETRSVEVIIFSNVSALDLATAIIKYPPILKPLLLACNVAARAIERDLQIKNINTYNPRLTNEAVTVIAGYLKPFLPKYLEIPALVALDRCACVDKEIRKEKGRWELLVLEALNRFGKGRFKKRKFDAGGQKFELDAASPEEGPILLAVDVKRIEARRDIHKRCDEIVNKASKLKSASRRAKFAAIVYYPFIDEHINIQNRLKSKNIDAVSFASNSKDSVDSAVRMLLDQLGMAK